MPDPQADPVADRLRQADVMGIPPPVKAQVWDAFQQSTDPNDFATRIQNVAIPKNVKADLWDLKAGAGVTPPATPPTAAPPTTTLGVARDVGIGFAKGAARTALDLGQAVHLIPGVTSAVDWLYGQPGLSQEAFRQARAATASTNLPQTVGGLAETAAELAVPVSAAAEAVPTTAKAGRALERVMQGARTIPVDVSAPGQVALRIDQLASRGGSMPSAVSQFLGRITDATQGPLTYEEARDWASNISRLSADEYGRLTPVIGREVANLRVALNQAVGDAAGKVGLKGDYLAAMRDYGRAMALRTQWDQVLAGLKRGLPYGLGAGASGWIGYQAMQKLKDLVSGP